jgi:uncharacterized membrane protein YgdD (TMEM256/DUF423 family)
MPSLAAAVTDAATEEGSAAGLLRRARNGTAAEPQDESPRRVPAKDQAHRGAGFDPTPRASRRESMGPASPGRREGGRNVCRHAATELGSFQERSGEAISREGAYHRSHRLISTAVWRAIAGLGGLFSVAAGAAAAHRAGDAHAAGLLRTGAVYGLVHAAALLALSLRAVPPRPALAVAGWAFAAGIVLFSGSLSALALTGWGPLALATPLGGVALMLGWLAVAVSARPR